MHFALTGVIFTDGEEWTEQRKFTFRHLKELGFGKNTAITIINEEMVSVVKYLKDTTGQPIAIRSLLDVVAVNVIWSLMTSERFESTDPGLHRILEAVST